MKANLITVLNLSASASKIHSRFPLLEADKENISRFHNINLGRITFHTFLMSLDIEW